MKKNEVLINCSLILISTVCIKCMIIAQTHFSVLFLAVGLFSLCLLANASIITNHTQTPLTVLITSSTHPSPTRPDDYPSDPQGALYLQQPPKAKAVEGEDVVLPCFLKSDGDEEQAVEKVRWYMKSLERRRIVLNGNETVEDGFAGRVFLSGDLSMGDLSLTLRNISVEDRGLYLCAFISGDSTVVQGSGTKLSIRKELGERRRPARK